MRAAARDTSVSALVRDFLESLGDEESDFARRKRLQAEVLASVRRFRAGGRLTRDKGARSRCASLTRTSCSTPAPRRPRRRPRAAWPGDILEADDLALSVQVLQEFYVQATRMGRPDRLSHEQASLLVESWLRFPVQESSVPLLRGALEIGKRHGVSYWDAAIIEAARLLECDTLLSEDLAHGRAYEGVKVVNPFRHSRRPVRLHLARGGGPRVKISPGTGGTHGADRGGGDWRRLHRRGARRGAEARGVRVVGVLGVADAESKKAAAQGLPKAYRSSRRCSPTRRSSPSTSPRRTGSTTRWPRPPWRPASTSCARSRWR